MYLYMIDFNLGIVFKNTNNGYKVFCSILKFKLPDDLNTVSYFPSKCAGE